jgi:hypothetical protein
MSWWFYMAVPVAADGSFVMLAGYECNYTYNVFRMYQKALSQEAGIRALHHMKAKYCVDWLDAAIKDMKAKPVEYMALNPPNGWGDYEGALAVLEQLASWCREVPEAVMVVS